MKPKQQKRIEALERMERGHSGAIDRRNKPGPRRTGEQREREMNLLALKVHRALSLRSESPVGGKVGL